uniref:Uncharacterized protein n=1 Tax=viral metagenome TaxID=1070528 RepID=A0A6C0AGU2_9ZZZZ
MTTKESVYMKKSKLMGSKIIFLDTYNLKYNGPFFHTENNIHLLQIV